MKRCPWWVRWYHRRLRKADRLFMWPQFEEEDAEYAQELWEEFTASQGQEHWQCECAGRYYADKYGEVPSRWRAWWRTARFFRGRQW